jgi:hypothetical protein
MSYSTIKENTVGVSQSGSSSSFMDAVDSRYNDVSGTGMVRGENGVSAYSMYNMGGATNTSLQGSLVAAFNKIQRDTSEETVYDLMNSVYEEAKRAGGSFEGNAIVDLFVTWAQCRDRSEGKGERLVSYYMFMWIHEHFPETSFDLLRQYPVLGYWKDLSQLYLLVHTRKSSQWDSFKKNIIYCFTNQLTEDNHELDLNPKSTDISLCAKYIPKEGRSFDRKTKITKHIVAQLFPDLFKRDFRKAMKKFRTFYTRLNRHIDTVEIKECSGQWSEIDFTRVPGRALNIHRKAFLNTKTQSVDELRFPEDEDRMKCRENFQEHLLKAINGEVKVKGRSMFIHELVEQILNGRAHSPEERVLIESQWNAHVEDFSNTMEDTNSSLGKGICLVDVSGSMDGTPMNVAIAMGIFVSSFAHPIFRDRFISFESTPHWIVLRYPETYSEFHNKRMYHTLGQWDSKRAGGELTLYEKVMVAKDSPWGGSTNFSAAHELILDACVNAKLTPGELPEWFMILSDMQFDQSNEQRESWTTSHETLREEYYNAGINACGTPYKIPQQIYWNLRGDTVGVPVQSDTPNTQLISGFNVSLLKMFLKENDVESYVEPVKPVQTPWDIFRKTVDSENYYFIRKVCSESTEGSLRTYRFIELVDE